MKPLMNANVRESNNQNIQLIGVHSRPFADKILNPNAPSCLKQSKGTASTSNRQGEK
ncbi:MAG: hypothetical protein ONB12_03725 [candidate division KSB1 bacterium]|nr:hypothetical protein [candidate division KSB1 bacterium]